MTYDAVLLEHEALRFEVMFNREYIPDFDCACPDEVLDTNVISLPVIYHDKLSIRV